MDSNCQYIDLNKFSNRSPFFKKSDVDQGNYGNATSNPVNRSDVFNKFGL